MVQVIDSAGSSTTNYYYDDQWRVLLETDESHNEERYYVFGNYIDEVLLMVDNLGGTPADHYYGHDHLFSPVVIYASDGTVLERYEYDAYGKCHIMDSSYGSRATSNESNFYLFTGRRLDTLDSGSLKIQYSRNRYYDFDTGRWMQRDPLGINPSGQIRNKFDVQRQYVDGMNLYEYVKSKVAIKKDPLGLKACTLYLYSTEFRSEILPKLYRRGNEARRAFSIQNLNMGTVRNRMKKEDCCCFKNVYIYDHGSFGFDANGVCVGKQCWGDEPGPGPYFGAPEASMLCAVLCKKATITCLGCNVGQGSREGFGSIFSACDNISTIKACKGKSKGFGCSGGWKKFKR